MDQESLRKARLGFRGQVVRLLFLLAMTAWMLVWALDSSVPLDAPSVRGTVVDIEYGRRMSARVEVEYVLPDGRRLIAKTSECGSEDQVVGRQVVVRYDPAKPKHVAVGDYRQYDSLYLPLAVLFGFVTLFVIGRTIYDAARE